MKILSKKILIILIVVIILSFLAWLIFTYSETNKQKENTNDQQLTTPTLFKTYHNDEYGFEFQYPINWEIKENIYGSPASKFNLIVVPSEGDYLPDPILFNFTTPEFADRAFLDLRESATEVNIGGIKGEKYEYEYESLERISIILPLKEHRLIIGAEKEYVNTFNQVLSTFKFLK